jgi:hypothetical protein
MSLHIAILIVLLTLIISNTQCTKPIVIEGNRNITIVTSNLEISVSYLHTPVFTIQKPKSLNSYSIQLVNAYQSDSRDGKVIDGTMLPLERFGWNLIQQYVPGTDTLEIFLESGTYPSSTLEYVFMVSGVTSNPVISLSTRVQGIQWNNATTQYILCYAPQENNVNVHDLSNLFENRLVFAKQAYFEPFITADTGPTTPSVNVKFQILEIEKVKRACVQIDRWGNSSPSTRLYSESYLGFGRRKPNIFAIVLGSLIGLAVTAFVGSIIVGALYWSMKKQKGYFTLQ